MTTARERMHMSFCPDLGACRGVGGPGSREACAKFDEMLDSVVREALVDVACKVRRLPRTNVIAVAPGIANVNYGQVMDAFGLEGKERNA